MSKHTCCICGRYGLNMIETGEEGEWMCRLAGFCIRRGGKKLERSA